MPTVIVGPESDQDSKVALSEEAIQNPYHRGVVPSLASLDGAPVLPQANDELTVNFAAGGVVPAYTTLFTLQLTTTRPSSFLWFCFTSTWLHNGPFGGNVAVNFRFRLNGVVLQGGVTDNSTSNMIKPVARNRRTAVTQGLQTLVVEVSHFAGPLNTIRIDPGTLPDLHHAALFMEEQL